MRCSQLACRRRTGGCGRSPPITARFQTQAGKRTLTAESDTGVCVGGTTARTQARLGSAQKWWTRRRRPWFARLLSCKAQMMGPAMISPTSAAMAFRSATRTEPLEGLLDIFESSEDLTMLLYCLCLTLLLVYTVIAFLLVRKRMPKCSFAHADALSRLDSTITCGALPCFFIGAAGHARYSPRA